jgi:steroid delta-isomerase-like uncharacterized protein
MSRDQTIYLINRMFVQMNKHDIDACVAFYTKDAELQDPTFPDPVRGDDRVRAGFTDWMQAFPDVHAWVVDIIVDGDKAAVEWAFEGTHSGMYLGVAPSGRRFKTLTTSHFHFRDGKISRDFSMFDATALQQLEALSRS